MSSKTGWYNKNKTGHSAKYESHRHSLASKGIKTTIPTKIQRMQPLFNMSTKTKNYDFVKQEYNMKASKKALKNFFFKHTGKDVFKDLKISVVDKFPNHPNKIGHYDINKKILTIRRDQLNDLKNAVSVMAHEIVHGIGKNPDETRAFENDLSYALGHAILD